MESSFYSGDDLYERYYGLKSSAREFIICCICLSFKPAFSLRVCNTDVPLMEEEILRHLGMIWLELRESLKLIVKVQVRTKKIGFQKE